MLPFLHEFIELFQIQQTSTHICPLNPPQSFQAIPSLHKSKRIYWNPPRFTQTARIHNKNKTNPIKFTKPNWPIKFTEHSQIYPNPPQSAKSLKSYKIDSDQQQIIKIQQKRSKSTHIVLNPAETTNIYPNKPNPNSIVKLQWNPCKPVPIHLHSESIIESQPWIHKLRAIANYTK